MRVANRITISVLEKQDIEKTKEAFFALFPFEVKPKESRVQGFNEQMIHKFEVILTKASDINKFLKQLLELLTDQQRELLDFQAESRLDERFNFFIRIDKSSWIEKRKLFLTDSGDCFHIRISLAVFPSKRPVAITLVHSILKKDFYSSQH